MEKFLPYFIILSLGGAFIIYLLGAILKNRYSKIADIIANIIFLGGFLLTLFLIPAVKNSAPLLYFMGKWRVPLGITLVVDGLSVLMLTIIWGIGLLSAIYSINYMDKFTSKYKFYALLLLMTGGMSGVAISGDLFNMYVFIEIAAIASYVLVAFGVDAEELEAAFKYMVIGSIGSLTLLLAIAFVYARTGTLNMADVSFSLQAHAKTGFMLLSSLLFTIGFLIKAALVPFHFWLPDAHPSAPAPISAMLSGVVIKVLGVYGIMRIFYNVLGFTEPVKTALLILAGLSMIVGVLLQLGQNDIKRLLAYCSISQIGYVLLGIGLNTPLGIFGAMFHLVNHAIFKSLLFLDSGAIEYTTHSRNINELSGLKNKLPVTTLGWVVGSFGASGLPPFNGFFSKLILIIAAAQAGQYILAVIAGLAAALTLASFIFVHRKVFWGTLLENLKLIRESPGFMQASIIILSALTILSGLLILPIFRINFLDLAQNALLLGTNYAYLVFSKAGVF
ncbi:MAG: NADH/ubiquinone/plastoquinone (complex I) [candidate division WOR-3 bacterium]|nr:NADH/ubiquinone/plastoquinone (complex I) [candidate division WOR-3 bacterium]MCX7757984.1 proton-conducting transporter membrane subunit [candidate division WOR-3 bacterium]MDW7987210.1 proton-conducting transporter membrane subunit [candidate division WOR-3 bacterium]